MERPPVWRSLLYVPAHVEKFVEKAHLRGADCIQLDLEDSVPVPEKAAARAAGVMPLGLMGTLAGFADPAAFHAMAVRSRRAGFEGASCINPVQVAPLNAAFTPGDEEVDYARRLIAADAGARARGRGAVALEGRMIDLPVVRRAERLLARFEAIRCREATHG